MSGLKRKRGRPRRDEAREINNFDILLIEEYRKRPAFYDREHPHYRNRELLEPEWHALARSMNCSVPYVKDRLTILRNRYSLEKRRQDNLAAQFNSPVASQWPLYENLNFLNDFIKTRRPYHSMTTTKAPSSNSSNENHVNGAAADDDDDDDEDDKDFKHLSPYSHQSNNMRQMHVPVSSNLILPETRNDTYNNHNHNHNNNNNNNHSHIRVRNMSELQSGQSAEKFNAFGHFLASSLIEMEEKDALRLVEKFTTEVVNCMLTGQ